MKENMSNKIEITPSQAAPAANTYPGGKKFAWCLVVTATMYMLTGGPPVLQVLFLTVTFFAGLVVVSTADEKEQRAISIAMLVFLSINAFYIVNPPHGRVPPSIDMWVGLWIVYKLLYVFALGYFMAILADSWVNTERRRTWAIVIAFTAVFLLAWYTTAEKQHESQQLVKCERVVGNLCTPVVEPKPWYTTATLMEDLAFGLQVVFLVAAFGTVSREKK